jgi:hypothetical protein
MSTNELRIGTIPPHVHPCKLCNCASASEDLSDQGPRVDLKHSGNADNPRTALIEHDYFEAFRLIGISLNEPGALRHSPSELSALAGRRLLSWWTIGIPQTTFSGRRQMPFRNPQALKSPRAEIRVSSDLLIAAAIPLATLLLAL